jgi:hypothetical protein
MKSKKYTAIWVVFLMFTTVSLQSCVWDVNAIKGNGNLTTQVNDVGTFDAIKASGMFKVFLVKGDTPGVRVETDENLQQHVKIDVRNGTLRVGMTQGQTYSPTRMEVYITTPGNLKELDLSGATSISADHVLSAENLDIEVSGAGDIDLELNVGRLSTKVSGAGSIKLRGNAGHHQIRLSGAASLKCIDLKTASTDVHLSGAGSAHVYATEALEANISGVGSIKYGGNPQKTSFSKSGLGTISPV